MVMPEYPNRTEVSVAIVGSGGAGVMATGDLLLATAGACGLYGLMTKSYGPQIRGGESACFLRLGIRPFGKQADGIDLLVALDLRNVERLQEELSLNPGAWFLHDQAEAASHPDLFRAATRCPIGWKTLLDQVEGGKGQLNTLVLGMVCYLLGLSPESALVKLADRFRDGANSTVFQAGWHWAGQTWKESMFRLPTDGTAGPRWVMTGNRGIVIGSLVAGLDFYAGYPITPATDIMEDLSHVLPLRGGVVIQAEDELAAINMAIGASFGGKKAMTATSGPGFSLMAEGLGLALMAELPLVVVDVQRVGPSTGIATKTEQSDLWAALASSHGDNPRVVLAPSSVRECIEMTVQAFNLAERYQVPVILLSDQFLGGRTEVLDPVPLDALPVHARQVAGDLGTAAYFRFRSSDEAVVPVALPGVPGGEFTAEGTEHDDRGWPVSSATVHQRQSERRLKKLEALAVQEGWIELCGDPTARVGIMGWGSTGGVVREAVHIAQAAGRSVKGIVPHLLFPPQPTAMHRLLEGLDRLYVAELSSMAQFYRYLRAFYQLPATVVPVARAGGMPLRTSEVLAALKLNSEQQTANS